MKPYNEIPTEPWVDRDEMVFLVALIGVIIVMVFS